jgi:hypothetical protein
MRPGPPEREVAPSDTGRRGQIQLGRLWDSDESKISPARHGYGMYIYHPFLAAGRGVWQTFQAVEIPKSKLEFAICP